MEGEFYHKNIFDEVVDRDFTPEEDEDAIGPKARAEFNIFAFTDAIGAKKKKDAWVLYQKALASGMVAEEIFWKVVWQIKSLLLAKRTNSSMESGQNAFVYQKAKSFLKNFKDGELENISESLVVGYHNARRGKGEIEALIEKTLLNL